MATNSAIAIHGIIIMTVFMILLVVDGTRAAANKQTFYKLAVKTIKIIELGIIYIEI